MSIQNSVFTNPSAFTALRALNKVNRNLDKTQNKVSTGLRVASSLDDASAFAVAQGIRGEIRALDSVRQGLNNSKAVGKVAVAGATALSNLLVDIRQKLTELANSSISATQRTIIRRDYDELISQAAGFVANATYNGFQLLTSGANTVSTLANLGGSQLDLTRQRNVKLHLNSMATATTTTAANAQSVLVGEFSRLEATVAQALGTLGAEVRALELQTTFLEELRDTTEIGLGNIVDADLARESARLTSQQIQQELSVQTLTIANGRPNTILGLFRR
ncbi:MAG: flagellin [Rhodospirillaceae bacterium]|nr:flagellin [Rhodospirillaceae bacterium]|tara:strand:+ start:1893 stop:2723 length:831 start_codon:yes stop_codon:yes gene_type:complete